MLNFLSMTCVAIFWSHFYSMNICQHGRRIAMTIQTGSHSKLRYLHSTIHIFHSAMTARTFDSFIDMHTVIEIRVIRYAMNTFPG